jgi:ERCC4-type nuclease
VQTVRRALWAGDYAVAVEGRMIASVERKSVEDLPFSLSSGRLKYALGELAALSRRRRHTPALPITGWKAHRRPLREQP